MQKHKTNGRCQSKLALFFPQQIIYLVSHYSKCQRVAIRALSGVIKLALHVSKWSLIYNGLALPQSGWAVQEKGLKSSCLIFFYDVYFDSL